MIEYAITTALPQH